MRNKLKKLEDFRGEFIGTFERFGTKTNFKGYPETTILLINIKNANNKIISDHAWFNDTKGFRNLVGLEKGDKIKFTARVKQYYKGYAGYREEIQWEKPIELDYRLSHPTKIQKIERGLNE